MVRNDMQRCEYDNGCETLEHDHESPLSSGVEKSRSSCCCASDAAQGGFIPGE
jgi:hypothetical protein